MISSILIRNKAQVASEILPEIQNLTGVYIISILDVDSEDFLTDSNNILTLRFSDITPGPFHEQACDLGSSQYMSSSDTKKILKFVHRIKELPESCALVVHCSAGICRSGAVGKWALKYSNMSYLKYQQLNPQARSNDWVFWKLIEEDAIWCQNERS